MGVVLHSTPSMPDQPQMAAFRRVLFCGEGQHDLQLSTNAYVNKPADLSTFFATVHGIIRTWLSPEGSA
jgi:hypothetical protein